MRSRKVAGSCSKICKDILCFDLQELHAMTHFQACLYSLLIVPEWCKDLTDKPVPTALFPISTSLRSATSPELIELEKREGNCHPVNQIWKVQFFGWSCTPPPTWLTPRSKQAVQAHLARRDPRLGHTHWIGNFGAYRRSTRALRGVPAMHQS